MSDRLFDHLTDEGRAAAPVNLRLAPPGEPEGLAERTAESDFHRSRGYLCYDFAKPISRCLPIRHR